MLVALAYIPPNDGISVFEEIDFIQEITDLRHSRSGSKRYTNHPTFSNRNMKHTWPNFENLYKTNN
ncbi:hypothetical protein HZS_5109 [Henneguya salminicola]|nr:hypothetical protein HZS_5109 [Henneguya salminicola]